MKSKTKPTSKNSPRTKRKPLKTKRLAPKTQSKAKKSATTHPSDSPLAIASPSAKLSPHDQTIFRAFQANLLSLISHELRTPLSNILNSLNLLESPTGERGDFSSDELIVIARKNSQRLHETLAALLDLASFESGTFHVRLREVDLSRLVRMKLHAMNAQFRDHELVLEVQDEGDTERAVLADPQKLGRALELGFGVVIKRAEQGSVVHARLFRNEIEIEFTLPSGGESAFKEAWEHGVDPAKSPFKGALSAESAFLTSHEDGLGSEFFLIHEIMQQHSGSFVGDFSDSVRKVTLKYSIPEMSSEEGLRAVLSSRVHEVSTEFGAVALGLVQVPKGQNVESFRSLIKKSLFRASDAVYSLPQRKQVALVLDDCKPEDAPGLLSRIQKQIGMSLRFGIATCPSEGVDPLHLIGLAERRLHACELRREAREQLRGPSDDDDSNE